MISNTISNNCTSEGGFGSGRSDFGSGGFAGTEGLASVVPEPAGWAMLIAGFGFTGAAMRRRRAMPST